MSDYLNVKEVAKRLKVGPQRIRRWIKEGRLEAEFIGGSVGYRVTVEALEKFKAAPPRSPEDVALWVGAIKKGYDDALLSGEVASGLGLLSSGISTAVGGVLGGIISGRKKPLMDSPQDPLRQLLMKEQREMEQLKRLVAEKEETVAHLKALLGATQEHKSQDERSESDGR